MRIKTNKDLIIDDNNIPEGSVGDVISFSRIEDAEFFHVRFDFGEGSVNFEDAERTRE